MFKHIKKYFSRKAKTYKVKKDLYQHIDNNIQAIEQEINGYLKELGVNKHD